MGNLDYIKDFLTSYSFDESCIKQVTLTYQNIINSNNEDKVINVVKLYDVGIDNTNYDYLLTFVGITSNLAKEINIHEYELCLIISILMTKTYIKYYKEKGYPDELLVPSLTDIKYQANNCYALHHFYGLHAMAWSYELFRVTRFIFGKLQFEAPFPIGKCYQDLNPTDTVIVTHIPRNGGHLEKETIDKSFIDAHHFFKKYFGHIKGFHYDTFTCHSWLLSPKHSEYLNPDSNIAYFIKRFELIDQGEYKGYEDVWRLFDVIYDGDISKLPNNTSLRRKYIEVIKNKEKTYWGYGVYRVEK